MELRLATVEDTEKVKELWSYSFETYEPYFSWYFSTVYRPERTLCCFKGDRLLSSLQLAPYHMNLRGKSFDFNYIVGVITSPEARGKGIASSLINKAFVDLKNHHIPLAVLKPVCPSFYASLGFIFTYEELIWQMEITRLKELALPSTGEWQKYRGKEDDKDLYLVYQKMVKDKNGYIIRHDENWRNLLDEHLGEDYRLWILRQKNEPRAYLLFNLKDRNISVRELGYADRKAMLEAFHFLYHHQNEADTLDWHSNKYNNAYLDFSSTSGFTLKPSLMARIIDLPSLLKDIPYAGKEDFEITLNIHDHNLPWNSGNYLIKKQSGNTEIIRLENNQGENIKTDIRSLTALLMGSQSARQLSASGKLTGNQETLDFLSLILPPCDNFMNEYN